MNVVRLAALAALVALPAAQAAAQEAIATQPGGGFSQPSAGGSLIIDQQRPDRAPVTPATPQPALARPTQGVVETPSAAAARATISGIRLEGVSLPEARLRPVWAPFVGRPLDRPTLQALADALTRAYADEAYLLFEVRIPAQSFAGGEVTVVVTEGMIGQVTINGDVHTRHLRLLKAYAAKMTRQKPLRRATLERYLSLIRDIPGLSVEAQLKPTRLPGVSVLALNIKRKTVHSELSLNDSGTPRLGRVQLQETLVLNSLFQQGDTTRLTLSAPLEVRPYQYVSLAHVMPLGSEGLNLTASVGYLRTRPKDSPIRGSAVTAAVGLTYPLVRSFHQNVYLTASLDGQNSDNAAYGQTLSSDRTRAVRAGATWSILADRRSSTLGATASFGLNGLGAHTDPRITDADFRKLNLFVSHDQLLGAAWIGRLRAMAQVSDGRLPSAEQFALGGELFGRAFPSAWVVGDSGEAVSTELAWRSATLWPGALAGSEIYGFGDWGEARLRERLSGLVPQKSRDLASAGAGVRLAVRRRTLINIEGATAVENPYSGTEAWRLVFGWRSLF